jgi:cytochrome c-type biogenesis protein
MSELVAAFTTGNLAILTNVCMLPLYPGLIAFLAGTANDERARRATGWLGLLVLAGILSMMIAIGLVLYLFQQSFGSLLSILLPIIYGIVIVLGVLMLVDRNPFAKLTTIQSPILRNPYMTAYLYGLLFGPMTLPCTGPIILSAFIVGTGNAGALIDGLAYFIVFGLGFGWPLVVLPLLARGLQRGFVGWLARHHLMLTRISGIVLIGIGCFGILTELVPQWFAEQQIEINNTVVAIYWGTVIIIALIVVVVTRNAQKSKTPG